VKIIHCYDPEDRIGTVGQFVYDFNCILDSRKRNFDIILQLGYTSSSIFNFLFKNSRIVTNMDGLEWKRSKYSKPVQVFLKYAEKLAVSYSDILIADSKGIKEYLDSKYNLNSKFIPYGADANQQFDLAHLNKFSLEPYRYDMLIARLEPENSVKEIIEGFAASTTSRNLVIVGSTSTNLGQYLKNNIKDKRLLYLEYISDINQLNSLRYYSNLYFHGHTVGGTNPSLLEAMASQALVCANDNVFNRSILGDDAHYFTSSKNVSELVNSLNKDEYSKFVSSNRNKIIETYNWESIIKQYKKVLDET
jgi:glycosyltransferase involved in cell wall biosynthesis